MNPVQNYILDLEGEQAALFQYLYDLINTYPEVEAKIKYKIPFFYRKSWICYLNPIKKGGVELAFTRGNELSNEQGLLEAKGRKQILGASFYKVEEIPEEVIHEVLQEAFLLDETVPYASKRKKK